MSKELLLLLLVGICFIITQQQLTIPLVHTKLNNHLQSSSRHHLLRQGQYLNNQHTQRSRLSHNLQYIKNHFNQISQKEHHSRNHQLTTQNNGEDHLKIQTFKLRPNVYSFTLPMKIGGYEYQLNIDSGSSDIFIKGQNSKGKPEQRYKCGQICIDKNQHYTIGYLDGRLQTYEKSLQVQIGDHKFNQSILVAYEVQKNFQDNQGLVGLSFPRLATNPNPTFLQTLKNQGIITQYGFAVNLNFQDKNRSFITFGSFDKNFFQGQLSFLTLTSKMFYYVDTEGISIGDGQILSIKTALFDTGNTCISIPSQYQQAILKQFNKGSGEKQNKCFFSVQENANMFSVMRCKFGDLNNLPLLKIHLDSKVYEIQKQFYMQACDRRPKQQKSSNKPNQGVWYCDLYIQSVTGMQELFLGDGFFNRYYTFFDLQKNRIGIAKNKQVIKIEKIIQNKVDGDKDDWKQLLTKLNPNQSAQSIKQQIQKAIQQ